MTDFETQGLSEDYSCATGSFDSVKRGSLTRPELLNILEIVAKLTTPEGNDKCPPSINIQLNDDLYTCFSGDQGILRCSDSQAEEMLPSEALSIIYGDLSISDFDQSKGHTVSNKGGNKLFFALFIGVLIAGTVYLIGT